MLTWIWEISPGPDLRWDYIKIIVSKRGKTNLLQVEDF